MAEEFIPHKDIQTIFKRLKTIGENKVCFDCRASNPTWASIPYGIFLCIDCSAVHRSLGVHLSFVKSTTLDINWSWLQMRHMQCGGNANANAFFRQHNLTTSDSGAKYKSRVSAMYKEKLDKLCFKSIRELGAQKMHLDQSTPANVQPEKPEEVDFFENITEEDFSSAQIVTPSSGAAITNGTDKNVSNVDVGHLSTSPPKRDLRVPTIGGRKPAPKKKGGLGAKKGGLGATKSKANFSAIESEAQQLDKLKEQTNVSADISSSTPPTEEVPLSASLMYQANSLKKEEDRLRQVDPKKAAQMERLGMGFGGRSSASHSVASSMHSVEQVKPDRPTESNKDYYRSSQPDSFMGFEDLSTPKSEVESFTEEPPSYESRFSSMPSWGSSDSTTSNTKAYVPEKSENDNSRSRFQYSSEPATSEDFNKKFAGAKGISSDQLFGNGQDDASRQKLDQYQQSDAISSADLFGDKKKQARTSVDYQSLKDNVSQVTGKLSTMASGVIGSLQSRYSGNN